MADIRKALEDDLDLNCEIFNQIVSAGETYPIHRNASKKEAYQTWMEQPQKTYVCVENKKVLGTYYLKQNHGGGGGHVCNCGYMVAMEVEGKGSGGTVKATGILHFTESEGVTAVDVEG